MPKKKKTVVQSKKSGHNPPTKLKEIGDSILRQARTERGQAILDAAGFIALFGIFVCLWSALFSQIMTSQSPLISDVPPVNGSLVTSNEDPGPEVPGFAIYTFPNLANRTMLLFRISHSLINEHCGEKNAALGQCYMQQKSEESKVDLCGDLARAFYECKDAVPHAGLAVIPSLGRVGLGSELGQRFVWAETLPNEQIPSPDMKMTRVKRLKEFPIVDSSKVYPFIDASSKQADIDTLEDEMQFRYEYFAKTGIHWAGTASGARPPPTLPIIEASYVGQLIKVPMNAEALHWHCTVAAPTHVEQQMDDPKRQEYVEQCLQGSMDPDTSVTYKKGNAELILEATSIRPRIFTVRNFLSKFEIDYIISQARPMLERSKTGVGNDARVNPIRTSEGAYLSRNHSLIMDSIYRRVALVTAIPEQLLTMGENVKALNVLHYNKGAKYDNHYDWEPNGKIESRFVSGLLYLNTPAKGGSTSFPLAKPKVDVPAREGNFVFFYDLLADGNGDVLSLHGGDVVLEGHKWVAPLWIWEPTISGRPHALGDLSGGILLSKEEQEL